MPDNTLSRDELMRRHTFLLFGLSILWCVAVGITYYGLVPAWPETSPTVLFPAAGFLGVIFAAWFSAPRRLPPRPDEATVEDYWRDARVATAVSRVLLLFAGGTALAAGWTILSGSSVCAGISLLGLMGLATHGPERLEDI